MKNFKNVLFLLTLFSLWSTKTYSEVNYVVSDVSIAPGGTATVEVQATGEAFCTVQMNINLPEGISIVTGSQKLGSRVTNASDLIFDFDGKQVIINSDSENVITGTSGTVFSFDIKADESLELGTSLTLAFTDCVWCSMTDGNDGISVNCTIKVEEASAETEKITLTKEYNTYVPAKDLDFTGLDIKAYYVTAVAAGEATLTEATTVAAGEGIIISGTPDDYEVPVAAEAVTPNSDNLLATGAISEGDYILYEGVFVPCSGGTLPDGKAFLPKSAITSGAKVITFVFGESTGINEVQKVATDGAIYNLSGMRVSKTQKGVYIMNGRKVIVK